MTKRVTFEETAIAARQFTKARKRDEASSAHGLAISLSLEANELLGYFQWNEESLGGKDDMASEIADIFIYAVQFADKYNIDIPEAIINKIQKLEQKYPVELFDIKDEVEKRRQRLEAKEVIRKIHYFKYLR